VKTIAEPIDPDPASVGLGSTNTDGIAEAVGELAVLSVIGAVVSVAGVEMVAEALAEALSEALAEALSEALADALTGVLTDALAESVIEDVDEMVALSVVEAGGEESVAIEEIELAVLSVEEPEIVGAPVAATRVVGTETTDAGTVTAVGSTEDAV
jgi:hypothetical protein